MTADRRLPTFRRIFLIVLTSVLAAALAVPPAPANAKQLTVAAAEGAPVSPATRPPSVLQSPPVSVTLLPVVPAGGPGPVTDGAFLTGLEMPSVAPPTLRAPLGASTEELTNPPWLSSWFLYREAFALETTTRPRKSFLAISGKKGLAVRSRVGNTGDLHQNGLTSYGESPTRGIIFLSVGW